MADRVENPQKTPGLLAIAAFVTAIVSGILNWYELTTEQATSSYKGTETTAGLATIGFGVILLICGIVLLVRGARSGGRASSIVAIISGLFILFCAVYSVASTGDALASFESSDVGEQYGIPDELAELQIKAAFDSGDMSAEPLTGAYVGIVPGALGLVAGIMGVRAAKKIRRGSEVSPTSSPTSEPPPEA